MRQTVRVKTVGASAALVVAVVLLAGCGGEESGTADTAGQAKGSSDGDSSAGGGGASAGPKGLCDLLTQERAQQLLPDAQFDEAASSQSACVYNVSAGEPIKLTTGATDPGDFDLQVMGAPEVMSGLGDADGFVADRATGYEVDWRRGTTLYVLSAPDPVEHDMMVDVAFDIDDDIDDDIDNGT